MTAPFQLKLRGIFLAGDSPEYVTNTAGDISSAIKNFFQYFITWFNDQFPPETRDDQIHRWTHGATPYLIGLCVLITCLCCWSCLFSCTYTIVVGIFDIVWSILLCILQPIWSLFCCILQPIWSLFRCILQPFWSIFRCILQPFWSFLVGFYRCLCCCGGSGGRMMRAPGRSYMKISRGAFEGNTRGYFRDLRGQPNNFVY